jgi:hypothetical protein
VHILSVVGRLRLSCRLVVHLLVLLISGSHL